ncbi:MAG: right-handed parallel beta-helix repeat-containing protein [Thermoleophilaceae bacterium]|nr:right-handed parallel beta-helix repeat-containing protein [Thermoleophilaceae bacterium]
MLAVVLAAAAVAVSQATAHVERASYWPNPAPDRSVKPPTGGKVPKARSLYTALDRKPAGTTRVVCQDSSISRLRKAIGKARTEGYKLRPSERARHISKSQGRRLLAFNRRLRAKCRFASIQEAVDRSGNNDRVVIMPGLYTEPESRAAPTQDPRCADLKQLNDRQDQTGASQSGAVSYAYQVKCPNDQNLIAVIGRANGKGTDPQPPRDDRHGIPNLGPCIRCNLQLEGSGVGPDDVIIDGGRVASGNKGPIGAKKDVGIRADRADGFVLRNMTVRHVNEHAIYVLEADGYRLERFKAFYAGEYGVLTFVEDHGLMQNCEAAGHGDSGLYPGAGAEGGDQRKSGPRRYTQEIRFCDMHHNTGGYSGTDGNSVWVHHNDFYDNALGFTTDVFTAAGHPGFPQDSDLIENNEFYSNNFNVYASGSDVEPTIPVPVGTGMWIAGGNHNIVRRNRFWNNWRRGAMLFAVPDGFVCSPPLHQAGCDPAKLSTSHNNRFYGNVMGRTPKGRRDPNGTDFWWDEFDKTRGNCWRDNTGSRGTRKSVTSDPVSLPSNCKSSSGKGNDENYGELVTCATAPEGDPTTGCPWFTTPREPK